MIETLFTQALGLVAPWQVDQVTFTPEAGRIDLQVTFSAAVHACPACGTATQPLRDRLARSWRHLDFFQYEAHLHAAVPRVACAGCGKVTQIPVPWAREGSRFTMLCEALTLILAPTMSVFAAGRLLRDERKLSHDQAQHRQQKPPVATYNRFPDVSAALEPALTSPTMRRPFAMQTWNRTEQHLANTPITRTNTLSSTHMH